MVDSRSQTVTNVNDDAFMDMHVSKVSSAGTPTQMWMFKSAVTTPIYFSDMHGTADGHLALAFSFPGDNMTLPDGTVLTNNVPTMSRAQESPVANPASTAAIASRPLVV